MSKYMDGRQIRVNCGTCGDDGEFALQVIENDNAIASIDMEGKVKCEAADPATLVIAVYQLALSIGAPIHCQHMSKPLPLMSQIEA